MSEKTTLDIIVPVGPGHEEIHKRALDSIRVAVTLADAMGESSFQRVNVLVEDDTKGELGRSAARNKAVWRGDGEWLFFLDADDILHPEALRITLPRGKEFAAFFGLILEYREGRVVQRLQIPNINSYLELLQYDPYQTLQMGHFVRRDVFQQLWFDEALTTGEDWHYYLRLWKEHKCCKMPYPMAVNDRGHHSTGLRSATGKEWTDAVSLMFRVARAQLEAESAAVEMPAELPKTDPQIELPHLQTIRRKPRG